MIRISRMPRTALVFQVSLLVGLIVLDAGCRLDPLPLPGSIDSDAGPDADLDAGSDAEPDADFDAGSDAEPDADLDAGSDAEPDADLDAGSDAEPDADFDAGSDAEPDADLDAGSDAEPDAGPMGDPNGSSCMSSADCLSGNCIDGVCCDNPCTSSCHACTAALKGNGVDGVCGIINPGTESPTECVAGACNTYGVCSSVPSANLCFNSAECAPGFCVGNFCCNQSACTPIDSCHLATCSPGTCTDVPRNCPNGGTCANGLCPGQCPGIIGFSGRPLLQSFIGRDGGLSHVVTGDIDGDGIVDLVRSSYGLNGSSYQGSMGVYRNNGDGTFTVIASLSGSYEDVLGLADMNNDGTLDVVQSAYHTSGGQTIKVYLNDGKGAFPSYIYTGLSPSVTEMSRQVLVDLNNDGYRDVMVRTTSGGYTYIKFNNAGTSFAPIIDTGITGYNDFDAVDLNADGNGDLVLVASNAEVRFGNGNGTFGSPVIYSLAGGANAVALRDLDADGDFDMVASNATNTNVLLNIGNGTFAPAVTYLGGSANIADINGDGHPDIVGSTTLFNAGNGTFVGQTMAYMPHQNAAFGDFNGDGLADIARHDSHEGTSILYNGGNGLFTKPYVPYNLSFLDHHQFLSADLNGDNLDDWAVATATNKIAVWINMGNGNFAPPVDYAPGFGPRMIAAADMNGDGQRDLIASGTSQDAVLFNLGGGTFGPAVVYPASNMQKTCSATGDFNGDGHADVARIASSPAKLQVRLNQGNGIWGPIVDIASLPPNPRDLVASDLNGDGLVDLVVHNGEEDRLEVFLSDGMGGFFLQSQLVDMSSVHSFHVADYDGDSYPDIALVTIFFDVGYTTVSIRWNNGDGTFRYGPWKTWSYNFGTISAAADVDGNGFKDIIFNRYGAFRVLLNDGVSLGPDKRYSTLDGIMVATDVNGDGISELLSSQGALHSTICNP